ncbi:MAG: PP0621 family protein, partial [Betaproteobacteria bacterium]
MIFWLVIVFAVLFAVRLMNAAALRKRTRSAEDARRGRPASAMSRCVECGVYLPASDAAQGPRGAVCGEPG